MSWTHKRGPDSRRFVASEEADEFTIQDIASSLLNLLSSSARRMLFIDITAAFEAA